MIVVLVIVLAVAVFVCMNLVEGRGDDGFASGAEIGRTMGLRAVRKKAEFTRPTMTKQERRKALPEQVGIELGRSGGKTLYASHEDVVLYLGPIRMGKTTGGLAHHVIDAPGACVAASTKVDLYELTAKLRSRHGRPVYVFNPGGLGDIKSSFRWSPIEGCSDPKVAAQRARLLIDGTTTGPHMNDREFWNDNGAKAVRGFLYAAALGDKSMQDVWRWVSNFGDRTPLEILESHPEALTGWVFELRQVLLNTEKTRASVETTASLAFGFMADPEVHRAVSPKADEHTFDVASFVRDRGTLYLLASAEARLAPLMTAFAGYLYAEAKTLASKRPGRRLDAPLMCVFDEATNICRVPLERWTSDASGQGIPLVLSIQGESQLLDVFGDQAGRTIWNNSNFKVVFPGLTDPQTLDTLTKLCGDRDEKVRSHSSGNGGPSSQTTTRVVPVLPPDKIRTMGRGQVLVIGQNVRPVMARVRPVWKRKDHKIAMAEPMPRPTRSPAAASPARKSPPRRTAPKMPAQPMAEIIPIRRPEEREEKSG